jgi:large subunit ribosomal protein L1
VPLGKKSFGERELGENYAMVLEEILRAKPASTKGRYIKSVVISSTMGPGIKIDPSRTRDVLEETTA